MASLMDLPTTTPGRLATFNSNLANLLLPYEQGDNTISPRASNPEEARAIYESMYGQKPEWAQFTYGTGLNDTQGWQFDPSLNISKDQTQVKVVDYQPDSDTYTVMLKTGDKQGTIYAYRGNGGGGYNLDSNPVGQVPWDTNENWFKDPGFRTFVAAAAMMAGAAALAANGAFGAAAQQAVSGTATGAAGGTAGGAAGGSSIFGPGGAFGSFTTPGGVSFPGASLTATGTGASTLGVPVGMTETALLSPELLAGTGLGGTGAASLTSAGIPITAGTGLSAVGNLANTALIPPGGFPGAGIPPGGGLNPVTNLPTLPGGPDIPDIPGSPNIPGGPNINIPSAPTTPTTPGKNLVNDGTGGFGLNSIFSLLDMWNKYQTGKDQMEFFNNWANKIFGQSGDFENMLMNTYTNPMGFVSGPEGQALSDTLNNVGLRQSMKLGQGTNSTNRDRLWQQGMLAGLNNYRGGLVNSANIGRQASGEAMRGAGQAFQGFADSRNWATPAAWTNNQTGTNIPGTLKDIWNTVSNIPGNIGDYFNQFRNWSNSLPPGALDSIQMTIGP